MKPLEIERWLRANGLSLGILTGQDRLALHTAAAAIGLYAKCDGHAEPHALSAYRGAVLCMQPAARHLAYHAIAAALDWHNRAEIWRRVGLPALERIPECIHGPRSSGRVQEQPMAAIS